MKARASGANVRQLVAGLLLVGMAACARGSDPKEAERLQQGKVALEAELERLRAENRRLRGEPEAPAELARFFSNDARTGTLAGLAPGDFIEKARRLYGRESRMNVFGSGASRESQYEWVFGGVTLRLSAEDNGRVFRVGVVMDTGQPPMIPTLEGVTLGRDTFASIDRKFGQALWTDLHIWGVKGTYTVAQTLLPGSNRRWPLQFAYEMPRELSPEELERIRVEVGQHRNPGYLMQFVGDRLPYLVRLEAPR